jgi:hypothetical protein
MQDASVNNTSRETDAIKKPFIDECNCCMLVKIFGINLFFFPAMELLLSVLNEVVGAAGVKEIDSEILSYVSSIVEFHDMNEPLLDAIGPMLTDFVGEEATKKVAARLSELKSSKRTAGGLSSLLSEPVKMQGSFVDKTRREVSSAVVELHDPHQIESSKEEGNRRKEKKAALAAAKAKAGLSGPAAHTTVDRMTFRRKAADEPAAPDVHIRNIDLNFGSKFLLQDAEVSICLFLLFCFMFKRSVAPFSRPKIRLGGTKRNWKDNSDASHFGTRNQRSEICPSAACRAGSSWRRHKGEEGERAFV